MSRADVVRLIQSMPHADRYRIARVWSRPNIAGWRQWELLLSASDS